MGLPQSQRAAQFNPKTKKIEINTIPIPKPTDDEILIRTASASLCHSDILVVEGDIETGATEPTTLGHEAVGEIVELGPIAKERGFKVGDYIGFINAYHACFNCEGCKNHYIYCTAGTMTMQGFACDGYFQEYCLVDSGVSTKLPSNMDPSVSAPIFCAGITAYNGVKTADLKKGEWLAVIGCGGLGQLAIKYGVAKGWRVVAIDIDDASLQIAQESGATHCYNSRKDASTLVKKLLADTGGCHAATVFAAAKAAYDVAPKILRVGGKLVVVGIAKSDIQLSSFDIAMRKCYVLGANNGAQPKELAECAKFTADNNISSPSKFYKLEQMTEMVETMQKEKMGGFRQVLSIFPYDRCAQARRVFANHLPAVWS